ncbi:MAG: tail fiber domain-containing protein [candidate division Zixibacteria bacterium]|nr:tail fiber domain-containing protein [candidate division Zixibacteria bacterium]
MLSTKCLRLLIVFLLASALSAIAAQPPFINYQGRLTDNTGNPVADGNYDVVFTIYDDMTGGTELWNSGTMSIYTKNGLFSVILGEIGSSVFNPANERFLGIKVGEDPEIAPRTPMASVPFAYYATNAGSSATCPAWSINGNDIYHANGNVGIGVTNPTEPLVVGKDFGNALGDYIIIGYSGSGGNSAGLIMGEEYANCGYIDWNTYTDCLQFGTTVGGFPYVHTIIMKNGKVGIGVADPSEPLVIGRDFGAYSGEMIVIGDASSGGYSGLTAGENEDNRCWLAWNNDNDFMYFGTKKAGTHYSNTLVLRDGEIGIGTNSPNYTLDVRGTIGNNTTLYHSDRRWKNHIAPIENALQTVTSLQGVSYEWNRDEYADMNFPDGRQIGLIAQDVEQVLPEIVSTGEDGFKSIDYARLVALLTEAVKTQQTQIDQLNRRIDELEKRGH